MPGIDGGDPMPGGPPECMLGARTPPGCMREPDRGRPTIAFVRLMLLIRARIAPDTGGPPLGTDGGPPLGTDGGGPRAVAFVFIC